MRLPKDRNLKVPPPPPPLPEQTRNNPDYEPPLSPEELRENRQWLKERREMKAQARLLMMLSMGLAGVLGWIGFDHVVTAGKAALAKLNP